MASKKKEEDPTGQWWVSLSEKRPHGHLEILVAEYVHGGHLAAMIFVPHDKARPPVAEMRWVSPNDPIPGDDE